MSIFSKKKPITDLPPLFSDTEIDGATYDQVQEFLISVNDSDFAKIISVAKIYRKSHVDVAAVIGHEPEQPASIFETQTIAPVLAPDATTKPDTEAGDFLSDDDELTKAFAEPPAEVPENHDLQS